jgi:hypothetical protein
MDFHIVIRSWLLEQPSEVQKSLQSLIDSYFYKGNGQHVLYLPSFIFKHYPNSCGYSLALEWISKNGEVVVPVSTLTTIRGILSHLTCCKTKKQFVNGLLKGGGANLTSQSLIQFGQMVGYFSNWNKQTYNIQ